MQLIKLLRHSYIPIKYISNNAKPPWITPDTNWLIRKKQRINKKAMEAKAAVD